MAWHSLREEAEIKRILDFTIRKGTDIEVHVPGDEEIYFSKFVEALSGTHLSIERLSPQIGNQRIQTSRELEIFFPFSRFFCRFRSPRLAESATPPIERVLIGYPEIMEVEQERKEERLYAGSPGFLSAVFTFVGMNHGGKTYDLKVMNYSRHGVGLLVEEEDACLLDDLRVGETICGILLFGESRLARISAVVRHKSAIQEGPYASSFLLGLESEDGLEEHAAENFS
jgi:hypothetical protein